MAFFKPKTLFQKLENFYGYNFFKYGPIVTTLFLDVVIKHSKTFLIL